MEQVVENKKKFDAKIIKGILFSVFISLALILIFALIIKFTNLLLLEKIGKGHFSKA